MRVLAAIGCLVTMSAAAAPDVGTYVGGSGVDIAYSIAVDSTGAILIAGATNTAGLATPGAAQTTLNGTTDAFVAKLSGGNLVWLTYLGGSADDTALSVAIGPQDSVYVGGITHSSDFPVKNAFEGTFGGGTSDGFIVKLDSTGSTVQFASFVGGANTDSVARIAVDAAGNVALHAQVNSPSTGFPLKNAFKSSVTGVNDAFIGKVSATGTLLWGTFLGGSGGEAAEAIALDPGGDVFVAGQTSSSDYPLSGGFGGTYTFYESYVARITAPANVPSVAWSLVFGGANYDFPVGMAVDGNALWLGGVTYSTNFPITPDAAQKTLGGARDAFVSRISVDGGTLEYSTYLGGSGLDEARTFALGTRVYVAGWTQSADFPKTTGLDGGQHGFIAAFDRSGLVIAHAWSLPIAGSGTDTIHGIAALGPSVYATTETTSPDLPNAMPGTFGGGTDTFVYVHVDPDFADAGSPDAGAPDAGGPDAGAPDAGGAMDAGARTDAGSSSDAGSESDAGVDAGAAGDGGSSAPAKLAVGCGCGAARNEPPPGADDRAWLVLASLFVAAHVLSRRRHAPAER